MAETLAVIAPAGRTGAAARAARARRILLGALIATDLIFIGLHLRAFMGGSLRESQNWNVELDGSYPEIFQYAKWALVVLCLLYLLARHRDALYAVLLAVFVYILADDALTWHESMGRWLVTAAGASEERIWRLRPQDFAEIAVSAVPGIVLLAALAVAWARSGGDGARAFAARALPLLALFAIFAIGVDTVHSGLVAGDWSRAKLNVTLVLFEDGGEMIVASVIAYVMLGAALAARGSGADSAAPSPAPVPTANGKPG